MKNFAQSYILHVGMSEDDYTESEVEDGGAADFRGQLSSALVWDKNQLCFMLKQNIENGRKVLFKWKVGTLLKTS